MPGTPKVCIIIPSYNSAATIKKCLASVLESDISESYEVIVVDDHSSDNTVGIVRENFPSVRIVANKEKGPSSARNYGASLTNAEFVAFTDSDCIVDKRWLASLLRAFKTGLREQLTILE